MTTRGKDTGKESQKDMLPPTSSTEPWRSDALSLSDELSRAADTIEWLRGQEMGRMGEVAGLSANAGCYCQEDPMDTSDSERAKFYEVICEERPSWSRATRKILGSRAPPTEPPAKKQTSVREGQRGRPGDRRSFAAATEGGPSVLWGIARGTYGFPS